MKRFTLKPILGAVAETLHAGLFNYMQRAGLVLCAAHTAVESLTDTTYSISAGLPASYDASGYGATTITYTAIGKMSTVTPYGSMRTVNVFNPISGAKEKTMGTADYGEIDLVFGDVPADAGQVIVKAAEASSNHFSF